MACDHWGDEKVYRFLKCAAINEQNILRDCGNRGMIAGGIGGKEEESLSKMESGGVLRVLFGQNENNSLEERGRWYTAGDKGDVAERDFKMWIMVA
ncbi:hypothetical protein F0562_002055 [Nyssa sinensis]|uniref:Uncharacterized protein n=1 Tax=Nyssa sinensis TaxID=561372 RepID=A0A5J5C9U9_9ASTE|nr:hypothetical protein F0562_002055 [Nyssa sinensis]